MFFFEQADEKEINEIIPKGIFNDSGTEINGARFWGSPSTPGFNNWAFNCTRRAEIKQHWNSIANDVAI